MAAAEAGVTAGLDDAVLPFAVPDLDVRGRVVRLGGSIDAILERHDYPVAVSRVLGEACALTVLLGTALKFEGRFQLQTKSDGAIAMMVVDFTAPDTYRAVVQINQAKLVEAMALDKLSTGALLGEGHLAMTIDQGAATTRYQGIVPLSGQSLEEAAHQYFRQSEQIPTRVRLAVGTVTAGGRAHWRAGGILVQFMPHSPERLRAADIHPGDVPEGHEILASTDPDGIEDDAWTEARSATCGRAIEPETETWVCIGRSCGRRCSMLRVVNRRPSRRYSGRVLTGNYLRRVPERSCYEERQDGRCP